MFYEVLQTEKAYRVQEKNTFLITFKAGANPTKIQVQQMLKKNGLNPLKVNKVVPHKKRKSRNGRRTNVTISRPTKYYITLKEGETLIQETNEQEQVTN